MADTDVLLPGSVGGIVGTLRTTGSRNLRGCPGVGGMATLAVIAVGFLLVSAAVIALARSSTARWERERRAARAPRREPLPPPTPPTGAAARLGRALGWTVVTAGRVAAPIRAPLRATGHVLAAVRNPVVRRLRGSLSAWQKVRHTAPEEAEPSRPAVDDAAAAVPVAQEQPPDARVGRRAGMPNHDVGHARPRLTRRIAARLVHRHHEKQVR